MNNSGNNITFFSLGSERIEFSKMVDLIDLNTKSILENQGYNSALKHVLDKDLQFLASNLERINDKIFDVLDSNNICFEYNFDNNLENVSSVVENVKSIIAKLTETKEKSKVGLFTSDRKIKKQKLNNLNNCLEALLRYKNELISIEDEFNKLMLRKSRLGSSVVEVKEEKPVKNEDALERTVNFYLNKKQEN